MAARFEPERLKQRRAPDEIHGVLRSAILNGQLETGSQLVEAHLAKDFGVSRAPLREALGKLEEEGLIVRYPFRGSFVAEVSASDIAEIAAIRYLVEPYAAQLSFEALRGPQKAKLTTVIRDLNRAADHNDIPSSIDAHLQFHRLFYEYSNNSQLGFLWAGWETKLRLFFTADHQKFGDLHEMSHDHEVLADLVLNGAWEDVRDALAHHVHAAPGAALQDFENAPEGARVAHSG